MVSTARASPIVRRRSISMRIRTVALLFVCAGLALAQAPSITNGGVLNGASFAKGQASNPWFAGLDFWDQLGVQGRAGGHDSVCPPPWAASRYCLSTGTQQIECPHAVCPARQRSQQVSSQLNVQVPWELVPAGASANVNVIVTNNGVNSNTGDASPLRHSPLACSPPMAWPLPSTVMERWPGRWARFPD